MTVTAIQQLSGSEAYLELLETLLEEGEPVKPRGLPTVELCNVTTVILDPTEGHVLKTSRKPSLRIAATEAMHLIGGISSLEQLNLASSGRFSQFADEGRLKGAYGPRAWHQLARVEKLLRDDPASRQAVVSIWNGRETVTRDVPCTTTLQFLRRKNELNLRVTMRSNDAFLGFPIDIMFFTALQQAMAGVMQLELGWYSHSVGSLHAYDRDRTRLEDIVAGGLVNPSATGFPSLAPREDELTFTQVSQLARDICLGSPADSLGGASEALLQATQFYQKLVPPLSSYWLCPFCRYVLAEPCLACAGSQTFSGEVT